VLGSRATRSLRATASSSASFLVPLAATFAFSCVGSRRSAQRADIPTVCERVYLPVTIVSLVVSANPRFIFFCSADSKSSERYLLAALTKRTGEHRPARRERRIAVNHRRTHSTPVSFWNMRLVSKQENAPTCDARAQTLESSYMRSGFFYWLGFWPADSRRPGSSAT
jgi:hypothetical protein